MPQAVRLIVALLMSLAATVAKTPDIQLILAVGGAGFFVYFLNRIGNRHGRRKKV